MATRLRLYGSAAQLDDVFGANGNNGYGQYYWAANSAGTIGPIATPGKWELLTCTYEGGTTNTAMGLWSMAANGVVFAAGEGNAGAWADPRLLPAAAVGQMLDLAGGNNGWLAGWPTWPFGTARFGHG